MKTIDRKAFVTIGKVMKTHGVNGELTIEHYKKPGKWAFLEIQGKPVPFKVDACSNTMDEQYIIKLNGVDSVDEAANYNGYDMLVPGKKGTVSVEDNSIIGYLIIDKQLGRIGHVEDVIEMPMQWLIQTHFNEKELLIPAVEPIIVSIDDDKKTISVDLPNGLTN
jgi:16S rRNA processing protein RimM